jgi:hypothetical protein
MKVPQELSDEVAYFLAALSVTGLLAAIAFWLGKGQIAFVIFCVILMAGRLLLSIDLETLDSVSYDFGPFRFGLILGSFLSFWAWGYGHHLAFESARMVRLSRAAITSGNLNRYVR